MYIPGRAGCGCVELGRARWAQCESCYSTGKVKWEGGRGRWPVRAGGWVRRGFVWKWAFRLISEQNPYEPNPLLQLAINPYLPCQSNSNSHTVLTGYVPAPHNHSQHNQVCTFLSLLIPPHLKTNTNLSTPLNTCTPPYGKHPTLPLTTLFVDPTHDTPSPQSNPTPTLYHIGKILDTRYTTSHSHMHILYPTIIKLKKTTTTLHLTIFFLMLQAKGTCSHRQYCSPDEGHNDARNMLRLY